MSAVSYNPDDDYRPVPGTPECPARWAQSRSDRWDRSDGCCVKIDHYVECDTSRPWLPNYRGWKAFGNRGNHDYLGYTRRNSRANIPIKYKSAEAAMAAVDVVCPRDGSSPAAVEQVALL